MILKASLIAAAAAIVVCLGARGAAAAAAATADGIGGGIGINDPSLSSPSSSSLLGKASQIALSSSPFASTSHLEVNDIMEVARVAVSGKIYVIRKEEKERG